MCFVLSEQDFPFFAIWIVEVLSWYILACPILTPRDSINCSSYAAKEVASDNVTSSDSVDDLRTIFCFIDSAKIAPLPCEITMPEWDLPL